MKVLGWILFSLGTAMALNAIVMDTTVVSDNSFERIHNNGLLNERSTRATVGSGLAIAGAVFATSGTRKPPEKTERVLPSRKGE